MSYFLSELRGWIEGFLVRVFLVCVLKTHTVFVGGTGKNVGEGGLQPAESQCFKRTNKGRGRATSRTMK